MQVVLGQVGCSAHVQLLAEGVPLGRQRAEIAQQGVARLQQQSLLLGCQPQALLRAPQSCQCQMLPQQVNAGMLSALC